MFIGRNPFTNYYFLNHMLYLDLVLDLENVCLCGALVTIFAILLHQAAWRMTWLMHKRGNMLVGFLMHMVDQWSS
jgi:hypothetical protein